jgi:hypothetical protein
MVVMNGDLNQAFQQLWDLKDVQRRGRLFEDLFCRFLYKSGFDVHKNPRSAKPRQTDLIAGLGDNTFLFELKWLKRRVDVDVAGQIKDRLLRTPPGTIGCICSVSGFTQSLIKDIELYRHEFEILLFNPIEIYGLLADQISISGLIDEKRRVIRRDGAVWFLEQDPRNSTRRYVELPTSPERFESSAESLHFRLNSAHISDLVFARTPLIFDEYLWAVTLQMDLKVSRVDKIRDVLASAANYLGLRAGGTFGIRQSQAGWFGFGSENFLKEIAHYSERYKQYEGRIHHSEELVFFGELKYGLFLLTARQSLTRKGLIHSGRVTIRLPGLPADLQPYLKFIRTFTRESLFFTPDHPLRRAWATLRASVAIPLSAVISKIQEVYPDIDRGAGVSGIVIQNPFFKNKRDLAKWSRGEELSAFAEPEYLICTLDDWFDVGDEVDGYEMTGLETVTIGETVLLHPRCTWKNLTKRIDPNKAEGFRQLQSDWNRREDLLGKLNEASTLKKRHRAED